MQSISNYDKVRIIALYVMIKNGVTEENLTKLFTHAQIGPKEQDMVRNLCFLGVNCINDVSRIHTNLHDAHVSFNPNISHITITNGFSCHLQGSRKKIYSVPRKERITEHTYQMSRWTPVVKDIMEDAIEDKLDQRHFPFLAGRSQNASYHAPTR